jgi:hypothetical protein
VSLDLTLAVAKALVSATTAAAGEDLQVELLQSSLITMVPTLPVILLITLDTILNSHNSE